jgi:hypothetical protein
LRNVSAVCNNAVKVYVQLFDELAKLEIEWVQLDEPVLVTELEPDWQTAFKKAYDTLANSPIKLLLSDWTNNNGFNLDALLLCLPNLYNQVLCLECKICLLTKLWMNWQS